MALGASAVCAWAAFAVPVAGAQGKPLPPEQPDPSSSATPSPTTSAGPSPTPDPTTSPGPDQGGETPDGGGSTPEPLPEGEPSPTETVPPEVEEPEPEPVPPDPLEVTIERLTPSTVPQRGDVTVTGTVRNTSDGEWSDLAVYLLTSAEPLTTGDELREAVASDPRTEVGSRIVTPGLYVDLPTLAPGASADYRLSVPRSQLEISGAPGVYWLGVHVLGTSEAGRLEGADGRARTFLPLVPPRTDPVEVALGLQLRQRTVRHRDGSLSAAKHWQQLLGRDGRLRRLVDLGSTAGTRPLTWVLDPAVADAALSSARGNPALGLDPEAAPDLSGEEDGTGTDEDAPPEDDTDEETGEDSGEEGALDEATEDPAAREWLTDLVAALRSGSDTLFAVPYGDLDVSAVTRNGADSLVDSAFDQGDLLLEQLGVTGGTRAVVPSSGFLSPAALTRAAPEVPVVLARDALTTSEPGTVVDRAGGGELLLVPGEGSLDGPSPGDARSALAVRQRLLADAALQALERGPEQPLVRLLPLDWDPGPGWRRARFFDGLDVPWVVPTQVHALLERSTPAPELDPGEDMTYPEEQAAAEIPSANVAAALSLIETGALLDELLTENDQLLAAATRQALLTPSTWSRERPGPAARRTRGAEARMDEWLSKVTVRGPDFVTMSSESGTFQVQLVNGLDQPVTIGLRTAVAGGQLVLSSPDPVELGPQGQAAVQIDARSTDIGIHQVVLQPVSESGKGVGSIASIDVRSSRVGFFVWIVMAVGGTLLFVAIVVRLVRRIARRRRTHGPLLRQGAS